jgi:branched-chain amino acid transport system permease protein
MKELVFALILGLGVGGLYAMLGTGLVTTFKGSGVINFAHGAFAMYTAYTYDELTTFGRVKLPWVDILPTKTLNLPVSISFGGPKGKLAATLIALGMAALLGLLSHLLVFRPLRNSPALGKVIGSVGLMLYLQTVAELHFGGKTRQNPGILPGTSGGQPFFKNFLGLGNFPHSAAWFAACAVAMGALVWAVLRFTRFGLATRACDENEKGASLLGYSPQLIAGANWVLSAVLAGMTGIIVIGLASLQVGQFSLYVVPALAAALFGNLTSVPMAVVGGFVTGMLQSGLSNLASRAWWPTFLPAGGVRTLAPLLIVVGVLYWRGASLPIRGSIIQRRQPLALPAKRPWVGVVIAVAIGVFLSSRFTAQWEVALTTTLVTGMVMLSLVVLVGFLGQISLAQTAIAGVAAYTAIRLASSGKLGGLAVVAVPGPGWPSPLAFLIGIVAAVVVGMIVGLPALRIRGVQLAIVSIAAVDPINDLILTNKSVMTKAATGALPVPTPNWFGFNVSATDPKTHLTDYWHFTAFAIVVFALLGLAVVNIRRGSVGRRFLAVRANERAAAAVGISVARTKLLGFAIASALAGVAGVLQAYRLGNVQATSYSLFVGLGILAIAYLGGITSVYGAIIGGLLAAGGLMSQVLSNISGSDFKTYMSLIGAVGLILTAVLNPEGIATGNALLFKHLWSKRMSARGPAPDTVIPAASGLAS